MRASIGSTGHKYPEARSKEDRNDQRGRFVFLTGAEDALSTFSVRIFHARDVHNRNVKMKFAKYIFPKGADLFLKGGQTKKQAGGKGTSRYSIGIKS